MGARPLELTLRRRLVAVLGPALVLVGVATVAMVRFALTRADEDAARDHARAAVVMLESELREGDDVAIAMDEVKKTMEAGGVRLWLRRGASATRGGDERPAIARGAGERDACGATRDVAGARWYACSVADADADVEAVAAIATKPHDDVVRAVGLGTAVCVALAMIVTLVAARASMRAPLASLDALVRWCEALACEPREAAACTPRPRARGSVRASSAEIDRLAVAFDALVAALFDALERERASSAHIAHELRTPLTAIRVGLEQIAGEGVPEAQRLVGDVERLARAIDAILVLSRPRPRPSERGAEHLASIVNVADLAREHGPRSARIDAPDEALVRGDEHLIALALRNIVENAAQYAGGATELVVRRTGGEVELVVRDAGEGLDDEACARMFERHWRGTTRPDGSGLGLALVRAVAERHGGAATARPNAAGRGIEVQMTLGPAVGWHP